jgi:hypothetical protein
VSDPENGESSGQDQMHSPASYPRVFVQMEFMSSVGSSSGLTL